MLGDILVKLNKLNKAVQFNHIDITHIGRNQNICTTILIHQYLFHRNKTFWRGYKFFHKFLKAFGVSSYVGYPLVDGTRKFILFVMAIFVIDITILKSARQLKCSMWESISNKFL
jgi:hypothetical protein